MTRATAAEREKKVAAHRVDLEVWNRLGIVESHRMQSSWGTRRVRPRTIIGRARAIIDNI